MQKEALRAGGGLDTPFGALTRDLRLCVLTVEKGGSTRPEFVSYDRPELRQLFAVPRAGGAFGGGTCGTDA